MDRTAIQTITGLETGEVPLLPTDERSEFHMDNIVNTALTLVKKAAVHGDASTEALADAIRPFVPGFLEHPDFHVSGQASLKEAIHLLNRVSQSLLLPHGRFLILNVADRSFEFVQGTVVDKSYLEIPYLDGLFKIRFAEARFVDSSVDRHVRTVSSYCLMNSQDASVDAMSMLKYGGSEEMQRAYPIIGQIPRLRTKYGISEEGYCEIGGPTRSFFHGIAMVQDNLYANIFDGKLEILRDMDAVLASRLVNPRSSLYPAIEAALPLPNVQTREFIPVLAASMLSSSVSGFLQELRGYAADGRWIEGHLAAVDYLAANAIFAGQYSGGAYSESQHYGAQTYGAYWLRGEIRKFVAGDNRIIKEVCEAAPKKAVERCIEGFEGIEKKHFVTFDARRTEVARLFG